uniref:Uncharacterized protein n=1 Tax=Rhizophora mucronata TaxID=61149 RepID=A0A2P2Q534_RHIMU
MATQTLMPSSKPQQRILKYQSVVPLHPNPSNW